MLSNISVFATAAKALLQAVASGPRLKILCTKRQWYMYADCVDLAQTEEAYLLHLPVYLPDLAKPVSMRI